MEYSELVKDFLDDAGGHLGVFDSALLSIEKNGYNDAVDKVLPLTSIAEEVLQGS